MLPRNGSRRQGITHPLRCLVKLQVIDDVHASFPFLSKFVVSFHGGFGNRFSSHVIGSRHTSIPCCEVSYASYEAVSFPIGETPENPGRAKNGSHLSHSFYYDCTIEIGPCQRMAGLHFPRQSSSKLARKPVPPYVCAS